MTRSRNASALMLVAVELENRHALQRVRHPHESLGKSEGTKRNANR